MKCPYCGNEMALGRISALGATIYLWHPAGSGMDPKKAVRLGQKHSFRNLISDATLNQAYYCGDCKKVVVDLEYGGKRGDQP